jgi:hypothetical protein
VCDVWCSIICRNYPHGTLGQIQYTVHTGKLHPGLNCKLGLPAAATMLLIRLDQRCIPVCTVDELKTHLSTDSFMFLTAYCLSYRIGALNTGGKPSPIAWRIGGGNLKAYLFIAQNSRYLYRLWRYERCFLSAHVHVQYTQYMSTLCTVWSLWTGSYTGF